MANIDIVEKFVEDIDEDNYLNGGMYFHALHRKKEDGGRVSHELEFRKFVECVGIRKTAIVSTSGEAKIMVLAWLIEPVEEFFNTDNIDKAYRQDIMTAVCKPEVKKITMRIDSSSLKSKSTDFTRFCKVVLPHPSETDISFRDMLSPIRVRVEYLPRVVAMDNICPCGIHYILSKFGSSVDNINFTLEKTAYERSYFFEGDQYENRIFNFYPSVTKFLLTCYDFDMLSDRPFSRALRGRFSDSFRHQIDRNMDEIHRIKNNKSVPYLVVNWGIPKAYKHLKYINYQGGEVDRYQRRKNEERTMWHAELILHLKRDPLLETPLNDLEFEPDTARPLPGISAVTENGCTFCPKSYYSLTALEHHIRTNHQNDLVPCSECGKVSPLFILSTGQLERHIATFHKKQNPFNCTRCHRRYRNKKGLVAHQSRCLASSETCNGDDLDPQKLSASLNTSDEVKILNAEDSNRLIVSTFLNTPNKIQTSEVKDSDQKGLCEPPITLNEFKISDDPDTTDDSDSMNDSDFTDDSEATNDSETTDESEAELDDSDQQELTDAQITCLLKSLV